MYEIFKEADNVTVTIKLPGATQRQALSVCDALNKYIREQKVAIGPWMVFHVRKV